MFDVGVFIGKPDSVDQGGVAVGEKFFRDGPTLFGDLPKTFSRFEDRNIVFDLLPGKFKQTFLFGCWGGSSDPGSGNIGAIAVGSDEVGIKTDHVSFFNGPHGTFTKPGVGSGTG